MLYPQQKKTACQNHSLEKPARSRGAFVTVKFDICIIISNNTSPGRKTVIKRTCVLQKQSS